jgi:hypothetical protein
MEAKLGVAKEKVSLVYGEDLVSLRSRRQICRGVGDCGFGEARFAVDHCEAVGLFGEDVSVDHVPDLRRDFFQQVAMVLVLYLSTGLKLGLLECWNKGLYYSWFDRIFVL